MKRPIVEELDENDQVIPLRDESAKIEEKEENELIKIEENELVRMDTLIKIEINQIDQEREMEMENERLRNENIELKRKLMLLKEKNNKKLPKIINFPIKSSMFFVLSFSGQGNYSISKLEISFFNEQAAMILGYTPAELLGQKYTIMFPKFTTRVLQKIGKVIKKMIKQFSHLKKQ